MRRDLSSKVRSISAALMLVGPVIVPTIGALAETRIQPGDKVQLTVFNHPDLSAQMVVTSAGDVRVPVAGDVAVEGLSQEMATERVQKALRPFLYHPSVDLSILSQGQSIFFTGSLVGVAAYQPGEALGAAVGAFRQVVSAPQNNANTNSMSFNNIDLRAVRIERNRHTFAPVDLEALGRSGDAGPRLEPGDIVLFRSKPVRVDVRGNLGTPATVYLNRGDTLAQAVAQTGSFSSTTSLTSMMLQRAGVDSIVSSAGAAFTSAAHDGDIVTLQPAPRVSVLGMVEKAGDTTLQTRPTLLNALYEAGGPNRYADLAHIHVSHGGVTREFNVARLTHGDLSQDTEIHDGDVIFVPEGHRIDFSSLATALSALSSVKYLGGL